VNVLATRTIQYRTDSGAVRDVILTVFEPSKAGVDDWRCGFQFHPPSNQRIIKVGGADCIAALLCCLSVARGYVEHPTEDRTSWQGMSHAGLPWHNELSEGYQPPDIPAPEANPGNLDILATRRLGVPDASGGVREVILTVYRPIRVQDETWECAFAFGTAASEPVRYGVGADFIEALLDALAMARVAYRAMVPAEWEAPESEGFESVQFLPYKVGRAYSTEPSTFSGMPDFSNGSS
jgi:hypothetical protein